MWRYEESIEINAPLSKVWSVLAGVERWSNWVPGVARVEGGETVQPGSRCAMCYGTGYRTGVGDIARARLRREEMSCTEVIPNQCISFSRSVPGMRISTTYVLEESPNNRTKVTRRVTSFGKVDRLFGWIPGFRPAEPAPKNLMSHLKSYIEQF